MRRVPLEVNILFHQVSEWCCEFCELGNEWRHVCRYPQELLHTCLVCRSWCISGVFHSLSMGVNFLCIIHHAKEVDSFCPMAHFSLLNTSPLSRATFIKLCRCLSCSVFVFPYTAMSSAIPRVPGYFSRIWSIRCRKTSWYITSPKSIRWKQNLPNGELRLLAAVTHRPVPVLRIKLGEVLGLRELVCDLLESGSVMMTSLNGLVEIFGIKAYA